jgi:phosphopantetheinyl transferase (holo-ACP synthase)
VSDRPGLDAGQVATHPQRDSARGWRSRAVIETETIAAVLSRRAAIEAEHFSPAELRALAGRHVQSLAGRLALKRALCRLLGVNGPGARLEPRDFVIAEGPNGAPMLGRLPAALQTEPEARRGLLFVSIAHTKAQAVGLAVHQRPMDDPAAALPRAGGVL